jgi:hypothetical protein
MVPSAEDGDRPLPAQLPRGHWRSEVTEPGLAPALVQPISEAQWNQKVGEWLPTEKDRAFVQSLMKPCLERGKTASWIAPPPKGVDNQPIDFEYVKLGA